MKRNTNRIKYERNVCIHLCKWNNPFCLNCNVHWFLLYFALGASLHCILYSFQYQICVAENLSACVNDSTKTVSEESKLGQNKSILGDMSHCYVFACLWCLIHNLTVVRGWWFPEKIRVTSLSDYHADFSTLPNGYPSFPWLLYFNDYKNPSLQILEKKAKLAIFFYIDLNETLKSANFIWSAEGKFVWELIDEGYIRFLWSRIGDLCFGHSFLVQWLLFPPLCHSREEITTFNKA